MSVTPARGAFDVTRSKKVAVVGNCQATFTAKLYREFFGVPRHEEVRYVDDLHLDGAATWAAVGDADLVLLQQRDFNSPKAEDAPPGMEVLPFPLMLEAFLWPYAHEPHIHNKPEPPLHDGPYPGQLGDMFLNRMIAQGVAPSEALERYLEHDIVGATHIDRLLELHLDQQRDRDERTGFELASILEGGFRDRALFMSPHHPNAWMFGEFLGQLLDRLQMPADEIAAMRDALLASPFPSGELPVHPAVARHFGLAFVDDDTRYKFHDEGRFSFPEHVLRYMRYEHNHTLRVGMRYFHEGQPDAALPLLDEGLKTSPHSAHGWRARGLILGRQGRREEAAEAFGRSVEEDRQVPDAYADLSRTLMELGREADAMGLAREAVALAPHHGPSQLIFGELLFRLRDFPGAVAAASEAARLLPMESYPAWVAAASHWHAGDPDGARAFCLRALNLEPAMVDPRNLLAETYEREGRRSDAVATLEEGVALGGVNDQTYSLIGNFHLRSALTSEGGEKRRSLELALQAFTGGEALNPHREFGDQIREMHWRLQQLDEEEARAAGPSGAEPSTPVDRKRAFPLRWRSRP